MRKPASLRNALQRALPELRNEPDRLIIWVEDGTVRSSQTGEHHFSIEYPLSIVIEEAKTDIAIINLAVIRWLQIEQPDLLTANANSFRFQADILDNETADIGFTINLVERYRVTGDATDGWEIEPLPEPDPLFDDEQPIGGSQSAPDLVAATIYVEGDVD